MIRPLSLGTISVRSAIECDQDKPEADVFDIGIAPALIPTDDEGESEPERFQLTPAGVNLVWRDKETKQIQRQRICAFLEVKGVTYGIEGGGFGRLIIWHDLNEKRRSGVIRASWFTAKNSHEIISYLLDGGLWIAPGKASHDAVVQYLQWTTPPERVIHAIKPGWHGRNYVLGDDVVGTDNNQKVFYDGEKQPQPKGTHQEWKHNVAALCVGNSRLVYSVSAGFSGPLRRLIDEPTRINHYVSESSKGKTTTLRVANSVYGGKLNNWCATGNALESTAESHNDGLLCLDELRQAPAHEIAEISYKLANEQGKQRMASDTRARRVREWKFAGLSTGEITVAMHAESAGKKAQGGSEVRVINIPADAGAGMGLFENIHAADSPATFAETLQKTTALYSGTAIREFLKALTAAMAEDQEFVAKLERDIRYFVGRYLPEGASGEAARVAREFGLNYAAGSLATRFGVTGWPELEAETAAAKCFAAWIGQRDGGAKGVSDRERAIWQVRGVIERHGSSRFQVAGEYKKFQEERVFERLGWRDEEFYYILPQQFREDVCKGFDHKLVIAALQEKGLLEGRKDRPLKYIKPPWPSAKLYVYAISASILERGAE